MTKGKYKLWMEKEEVCVLKIMGPYIQREKSREIPVPICRVNLISSLQRGGI